jgi:hypothetical protein
VSSHETVLILTPVKNSARHLRRHVWIDGVGGGADASLIALAADPAIVLHGFVDDPTPLYAAADIAVAPIRAGGGTRIKILEAFARGVPVVATHLAAEGIDTTFIARRRCRHIRRRLRVPETRPEPRRLTGSPGSTTDSRVMRSGACRRRSCGSLPDMMQPGQQERQKGQMSDA